MACAFARGREGGVCALSRLFVVASKGMLLWRSLLPHLLTDERLKCGGGSRQKRSWRW